MSNFNILGPILSILVEMILSEQFFKNKFGTAYFPNLKNIFEHSLALIELYPIFLILNYTQRKVLIQSCNLPQITSLYWLKMVIVVVKCIR